MLWDPCHILPLDLRPTSRITVLLEGCEISSHFLLCEISFCFYAPECFYFCISNSVMHYFLGYILSRISFFGGEDHPFHFSLFVRSPLAISVLSNLFKKEGLWFFQWNVADLCFQEGRHSSSPGGISFAYIHPVLELSLLQLAPHPHTLLPSYFGSTPSYHCFLSP